MKFVRIIIVIAFFSLIFTAVVFAATEDRRSHNAAYHDATSTNFELKGGVGDPAVGRSTSSNYIIDHGLVIESELRS